MVPVPSASLLPTRGLRVIASSAPASLAAIMSSGTGKEGGPLRPSSSGGNLASRVAHLAWVISGVPFLSGGVGGGSPPLLL
eukprot:8588020-Pyramimonas_sp.AAC.1